MFTCHPGLLVEQLRPRQPEKNYQEKLPRTLTFLPPAFFSRWRLRRTVPTICQR